MNASQIKQIMDRMVASGEAVTTDEMLKQTIGDYNKAIVAEAIRKREHLVMDNRR